MIYFTWLLEERDKLCVQDIKESVLVYEWVYVSMSMSIFQAYESY